MATSNFLPPGVEILKFLMDRDFLFAIAGVIYPSGFIA